MRYLGTILLVMILLVTACAETPPLPTLVPTNTPEPTATATATPLPTPTALPSVVELTRATDPSQQAFIRVVHAVPDLPTVDVFVERLAVASNLDFGGLTEPSGIVAGDYFIRVVPRGVRPDAGENLLEEAIAFQGGDRLMLVLTGTAANLALTTFPESTDPLNSAESRVTFLNLTASGSALTVTQGTETLVSGATYGQPTTPVILPAGETLLNFQADGSPALEYPLQLRERVDYTLILAGTAESPAVIEVRNPVMGRVQLRLIHAAPSIGPVDAYLDTAPFVTGLDYARASDRQGLSAGSYTVAVYPRDADPAAIEALGTFQVNANNDEILSFILIGEQSDLRLIPYREDFSPTAPDEARVAFMNTLSNVNRARVDTQVGPLPEVGDLSYGQPPVAVDIPLVNYTIFWNAVENDANLTQLESASNLEFEPGLSYLYLLTGQEGDQPLIFSDRVGIDETPVEMVENADGTVVEASEVVTRARLINTVTDNAALDLVVNEELLASQISYAQGSALAAVPPRDGSAEISVRVAGTDNEVAAMVVPLEPGSPYTVIVYGSEINGIQIAVLPDASLILEGGSSHLRLFNATQIGDIRFGLAYSPTAETSPVNRSVPPESENFRRSMTVGMEGVIAIADVDKGNFSPVGIAPAGLQAVHILDTLDEPSTVAATIRAVELQPGGHYDVVAYQEPDSRVVQAFIVAYPAVSD